MSIGYTKIDSNQRLLLTAIAPAPTGDEIVNFLDFASLAENWLAGQIN
jgi:hypothetical protein